VTEVIASFAEVSDRYDAAFVDLWGCMHNGLEAFPDAVEAMRAFRAQGGRVVLVTNAPRPRASVEAQIERMGIPRDSWDAIATSGDAARVALFQARWGAASGSWARPPTACSWSRPASSRIPSPSRRCPCPRRGIVCCGPFDPYATPT
jgi:hypothetical protein